MAAFLVRGSLAALLPSSRAALYGCRTIASKSGSAENEKKAPKNTIASKSDFTEDEVKAAVKEAYYSRAVDHLKRIILSLETKKVEDEKGVENAESKGALYSWTLAERGASYSRIVDKLKRAVEIEKPYSGEESKEAVFSRVVDQLKRAGVSLKTEKFSRIVDRLVPLKTEKLKRAGVSLKTQNFSRIVDQLVSLKSEKLKRADVSLKTSDVDPSNSETT